MKELKVAQDVVPIAKFKAEAARWMKRARDSGSPIVITLNGEPAGVLVSPAEFDRIAERERFLASVETGIEDVEAGRTLSTSAARRRLLGRNRSR